MSSTDNTMKIDAGWVLFAALAGTIISSVVFLSFWPEKRQQRYETDETIECLKLNDQCLERLSTCIEEER